MLRSPLLLTTGYDSCGSWNGLCGFKYDIKIKRSISCLDLSLSQDCRCHTLHVLNCSNECSSIAHNCFSGPYFSPHMMFHRSTNPVPLVPCHGMWQKSSTESRVCACIAVCPMMLQCICSWIVMLGHLTRGRPSSNDLVSHPAPCQDKQSQFSFPWARLSDAMTRLSDAMTRLSDAMTWECWDPECHTATVKRLTCLWFQWALWISSWATQV